MEAVTRFKQFETTFYIDGKHYLQHNAAAADDHFFKVFQLDLISGDPATALSQPRSMVLTEETAMKYYGTSDVLGKTFEFSPGNSYMITGVMKSMPENSHFRLEMIVDFSLMEEGYSSREIMMQAWHANDLATYFLLKEDASLVEVESRFPDFFTNHMGEEANRWTRLYSQKVTDIHLHSNLDDEQGVNGDITHVYTFAAAGLLILIISIINYVNLSTAMSINRAKEVGVRKVLGAVRPGLIGQFMVESIVTVFLSTLVAFVLAFLALPYLRDLTGSSYAFGLSEVLVGLALVSLVGIVIGLVAGGYPALVISKFRPLQALKTRLSVNSGNASFRRILVIVQFSISSILILSTGLVFQQLDFIQDKNLGYEKDHMLIFYLTGESGPKEEAFKESLLNHSSILSYGGSSHIPSTQLTAMTDVQAEVNDEMLSPEAFVKNLRIDPYFLPNYDIEIVAGRNFDPLLSSDSTTFIMNEAAVQLIGWTSNEEAIDKRINYNGKSGRVIGIAKDVHFETLHSRITPVIFLPAEEPLRTLSVKMTGDNLPETLRFIEDEWTSFFPEEPAQYYFLDERFNELYAAEMQRSELITLLSLIAILLACLGLFGLASFTVVRRTREIGIRKVLGASIRQILVLLSKEFVILVGISLIIGFPVALSFTQQWLENYAYRIEIGPLPFILTGLLSVGMAFAAVSVRALKAATDNPVKSLRYE